MNTVQQRFSPSAKNNVPATIISFPLIHVASDYTPYGVYLVMVFRGKYDCEAVLSFFSFYHLYLSFLHNDYT